MGRGSVPRSSRPEPSSVGWLHLAAGGAHARRAPFCPVLLRPTASRRVPAQRRRRQLVAPRHDGNRRFSLEQEPADVPVPGQGPLTSQSGLGLPDSDSAPPRRGASATWLPTPIGNSSSRPAPFPLLPRRLHDQADRRRSQLEAPRHHGLRDSLVEDAPCDQGVAPGDPTPAGRRRTLQPAHRPGDHAVAPSGPAADLGEAEALPVDVTVLFALGFGDIQGVQGAARGSGGVVGGS